MLNITKLDYYYNKTDIDTLKFNHIHLSMCVDINNIELSALSIASILNTSHPYTYIHFHILVSNFTFKDMIKIIQLKKINKNIDFIFYNSKQAEYDFGDKIDKINDLARILAPEIVNNTNKLLSLSSMNIIAQKDLSEIYFYNLEDNYFGWVLDGYAGNNKQSNLFFQNNFYPNDGVILINVRLFREDNLYQIAFWINAAYAKLNLPYQDIFVLVPVHKVKIMPLKYSCINFFEDDEDINKKSNYSDIINNWFNSQKKSPFHYTYEEILDAAYDPILLHYSNGTIQEGIGYGCNSFTYQWVKYAILTGLYKDLKSKYPLPFFVCKGRDN